VAIPLSGAQVEWSGLVGLQVMNVLKLKRIQPMQSWRNLNECYFHLEFARFSGVQCTRVGTSVMVAANSNVPG
jgi:hypothetical protein